MLELPALDERAATVALRAPGGLVMLRCVVWVVSCEVINAQLSVTNYETIAAPEDVHLNKTDAAWRTVKMAIVPAALLGSLLTCLVGEVISGGGLRGACAQRGDPMLWLPQLYESHLGERRVSGSGAPRANSSSNRYRHHPQQKPIQLTSIHPEGHVPAQGSTGGSNEREELSLPQVRTQPQPSSVERVYT